MYTVYYTYPTYAHTHTHTHTIDGQSRRGKVWTSATEMFHRPKKRGST